MGNSHKHSVSPGEYVVSFIAGCITFSSDRKQVDSNNNSVLLWKSIRQVLEALSSRIKHFLLLYVSLKTQIKGITLKATVLAFDNTVR